MSSPWQLFLTWGVMVGIGSGAGAVGMAAAVANRWFVARSGLAMGLLTAANAAGQLIFLPLLAVLAERYGWQGVAVAVTLAIAAVIPIWRSCCRNRRPMSGLDRTARPPNRAGATTQRGNPFVVAMSALLRASRSLDFWLLCSSFAFAAFRPTG